MFKKNLGKQLKLQAKDLGACEQGLENLEALNKQELINRFIHYINFSMKNNFPSNDFIKKNFDSELLHRNNIYVDDFIERRNARTVVVIQGNSKGQLMYDGMTVAEIYVRHNSELTIDCSKFSKVFINIYDNSKVKVIQHDTASVYVYKHGDSCSVITEGDVMERNCKK